MDGNPAGVAARAPECGDAANPAHAVGIGPGDEAFVTERTRQILEDAEVVVGFETVTERIAHLTDGDILACSYDDQTEMVARFGERVAGGERGVAVLWGDPNVSGYQFLGRVEKAVDGSVQVVPGVSSIQVAASRSRIPLEHASLASLHRRGEVTDDVDRLATAAREGRHLVVIVRPYDWMPPEIASALIERGVDPETTALVLQELTLPDEAIERMTLGALAAEESNNGNYSDRTILTVRTNEER